MRITNQMIQNNAQKSGLPINQGTLLDIMNQGSSANPLSGLGKSNQILAKLQQNKYSDMEESAGQLKDILEKLSQDDEDSLFADALKSGSSEKVVKNIKSFVETYNDMLSQLRGAGGTLNQYYVQQMNALMSENIEALKKVGITQSSNGTLNVDEKMLDAASISDLKSIFGSSNNLTSRMEFVIGKIEENAKANAESTGRQYTAQGTNAYLHSTSKYNYKG